MELFLLLIFLPVGLIVSGIGLSEIKEELDFKMKAIKVKGYIVGKVSARYKPKIQFNGFQAYTSTTDSTDVRKLAGYIGIIKFTTNDGFVYQIKTKQIINYDIKGDIEVLYNPEDPYDVMIDAYYQIGHEKYYRLIGGTILIFIPILIIILR